MELECVSIVNRPPLSLKRHFIHIFEAHINSTWQIVLVPVLLSFFHVFCPCHLPLLSVVTLCCVCLTCLCVSPIWCWLRLCHWFGCHICHTHVCQQLLLLGLAGLQEKASPVDFFTGWLICLSGHSDPWPRYHLLLLPLLVNVTLDSLMVPPSPFFCYLHHPHAWLPGGRSMERSTLATVGCS